MISILCDNHRAEIADAMTSAGLPTAVSTETHGHLPEKELDSLLVRYTNVLLTLPPHDDCLDCKLVGLSKRGKIEELASPDEWIWS